VAVRKLQQQLRNRFGISGPNLTSPPHVTLLGIRDPDDERLRSALDAVAARWPPFTVRAHGYGFFCGTRPYDLSLHVNVVRTPMLSALQRELREAVIGLARLTSDGHFGETTWMPHITLADRDLTPALLGRAAGWLGSHEDRRWHLTVDNLALLSDRSAGASAIHYVRFAGQPTAARPTESPSLPALVTGAGGPTRPARRHR
jgi:2'-5' RNA ligase